MEGVSIRIERSTWHDLKVQAAQKSVPIGELATRILRAGLRAGEG
jgi:predicted DNA-binding ribbon-helix-helix protein